MTNKSPIGDGNAPTTATEGGHTSRLGGLVRGVVRILASAQLTTILLLLGILIVFVGTLAQVYQDIWAVIDTYFRAWVCWIDVKVFFPPSFFPWAAQTDWESWAIQRLPFPGGALIGLALAINLLAAHSTRFAMRARGGRLVAGLAVLALGILVTWLVIATGHNRHGLQGEPLLEWSTLWLIIKIGLLVLWLGCLVGLVYVWLFVKRKKTMELGLLASSAIGLGLVLAWVFVKGESATLTDASLRILYQLIQGQIAALVLLLACVLLFNKRAGLALLHGGVGLLMFGELFVSYYAAEQQMTLSEGQTVNFTRDIRSLELVIRVPSPGKEAEVIAVPLLNAGHLTRFGSGSTISLPDLPFDAHVVDFLKNAEIRPAKPQEENLATQGVGVRFIAEPAPVRSSIQGGDGDLAAVYLQFTRRDDAADLGTYLLSQRLPPDQLTAADREYSLAVRFRRYNKPYQITLLDVRKDDHVGTTMAKNYASRVRLQDPSRNVDFETKIWMNNPMRYAGETYYQSGYRTDPRGVESSTLQVVQNTGWMIPYVSCMIAATGMLAHLLPILLRFLKRIQVGPSQEDEEGGVVTLVPAAVPLENQRLENRRRRLIVPLAIALMSLLWIGSKAVVLPQSAAELQLEQFGKLPVMFEGRTKPFDTLARNSLRILSRRETYRDAEDRKQPAVRWLLDVIARPDVADRHRIFRIENLEVLETFGLERRPGFRYSWEELIARMAEFQKQASMAEGQAADQRTFQQRKLLQFAERLSRYRQLTYAFRPYPIPPRGADTDGDASVQQQATEERLAKEIESRNTKLQSMSLPLAVPGGPTQQPWVAYSVAQNTAYLEHASGGKGLSPALAQLSAVFSAYEQENVPAFNDAIAQYERFLAAEPPPGLDMQVTRFEAYMNHFAPFFNLLPLYAIALLLTALAWFAAAASPRISSMLRSSAFWLIVITLAVHTLALAGRVIISGRPPVTNLYSSAVFVGWGCVVLGLCLEVVSRMGIGNLVASAAGLGTLIIAHFLAADGDTIRVLQAVLDTQFWLRRHVLTVTLGYSATFLAGMLGVISLGWLVGKVGVYWIDSVTGRRLPSGWLNPQGSDLERVLATMTYGTISFAGYSSVLWERFWEDFGQTTHGAVFGAGIPKKTGH